MNCTNVHSYFDSISFLPPIALSTDLHVERVREESEPRLPHSHDHPPTIPKFINYLPSLQSVGLDAALYFSPFIFGAAGIESKRALLGATVGVGVCKTLFLLISMGLMDRVGRRPLLLTSCVGKAC